MIKQLNNREEETMARTKIPVVEFRGAKYTVLVLENGEKVLGELVDFPPEFTIGDAQDMIQLIQG